MVAQTTAGQALKDALHATGLRVLAGLYPDNLGTTKTLFLIGPDTDFWVIFQQSPEANDGSPDPIDRWSTRILGEVAKSTDAKAYFPFGGPPYAPFIRWALDSGRCFQSPAQLLVHDDLGLWVSFRGALGFADRRAIPATTPSPCLSCAKQPCLSACPADALNKTNYNVAACHVFLDTDAGHDCISRGCAVRRACPVGQSKRCEAQSAFHMSYFHRKAHK